ncbi:MAG TPA: TonB-dependent receptor [Steroidobacteraceae bacterium]|nr:TonB-dependent receptor [Steroidobacteraceae bacterium]
MELRVAIAGILALAAGAAANAQESQAPETMVLEEIVVTAEKRSANLQDVPVAISAFTSETRDLIGITNIQDLTDFTPGLSYASTLDRMSLRGVGRLTNNYGSDPGIATYSDGFYTASNVEAGKAPMFTDRIEVLRGPQGTLYGRNSIGGALNVVSKRPTETTQGEVRAVAGSYDLQTYAGSVSGPITDWLRYRVAANGGGQGEGFFEDVNSNETEGGQNDDMYAEAQLEFNIGEAMDGWFKYAKSEWDQARRVDRRITPYDIAPTFFGAPGATTAGLFPNPTFGFTGTNPALADERQYDTDTPFRTKLDDVNIFTLETVNHFGGVDLKYVGGYQGYTYQQVSDFDGIDRDPFNVTNGAGQSITIFPTIEAFYHEDKEYYSNEINLISTGEGAFQWIVGLYQYHEQVNQFQGIRVPLQPHLANPRLGPPNAGNGFNPPPGPANPNHDLQNAGALLEADAHAVFGQVDWQFSDTWKTTVGLRYTEDEKVADEYRTRVVFLGNPALPFSFYSENATAHLEGKWDAVTGTAGLEWSPGEDILAYGKYTRGYKSGGFNAGAMAPGRTGYTEPEFINAYELGLKQTFAQRLTANLSVFFYDYQDAQYPSTVRDATTGLLESRFFNLEKVTSMGAELETVWAVTDAFVMRFNYSYLDTEIDDPRCFVDGGDTGISGSLQPDARPCTTPVLGQQTAQLLDGGELPSSPNHKVAFNANYTFFTGVGNLTLGATYTYKDEAYYSVFTRDHYLAPSYDNVDFRALWSGSDNKYTFIAFVNNAFDDVGYEAAGASMSAWGTQSRTLSLTAPRTYGLEVQFRFGN